MKKIFYLKELLRRKKFLKKELIKLRDYISPGKYKFNDNALYLIKNNINDIKIASKMFEEKFEKSKASIYDILKKIIVIGKVKIKCESKSYYSTAILLTSKYKSLKMFDFKNNVIINKFFNCNSFYSTIDNYNYFSKNFRVPKILKIDYYEMIFIEELIPYEQISKLNEKIIPKLVIDILNNYISYVEKSKNLLKTIKVEKLSGVNTIFDDWNPFMSEEILLIKSLGDLMYKNILYKNGELYYIDFELSNYNFILYDFFTFIFYSYYNYNQRSFFDKYINGEYDVYLNRIFSIGEKKFDKTYKIEYFKIFLIERINLELNFNQNVNVENIKRKFYELVRSK